MFFIPQHDDDQDTSQPNSIFPGDMVHLGGLLPGYNSDYQVIAATHCQLLHLSQKAFEPFVASRSWLFQSLIHFVKRPSRLQLMHPDDDYMWLTDRHVNLK